MEPAAGYCRLEVDHRHMADHVVDIQVQIKDKYKMGLGWGF